MAMQGPFDAVSGGYEPMVGTNPQKGWSAFSSAPGGVPGMLALNAVADTFMQSAGMTAGGMHGDQNMFDRFSQKAFSMFHQQVIANARETEKVQMERNMRRGLDVAGFGNSPLAHHLPQVAEFLSYAAPALSQIAPGFLNLLTGPTGSASVAAQELSMASRYRLDPITGSYKPSAESLQAMTESLKSAYVNGDTSAMSGLMIQEAAALQGQLGRRGMLPSTTPEELARKTLGMHPELANKAMAAAGIEEGRSIESLSSNEISKLSTNSEVREMMKGVDAEAVRAQVQKYSGTIAAMKEVMAEIGKFNLPVSELLNAAQALTNGGLTQMSPTAVEMQVRRLHGLAEKSGIGIHQMVEMSQHAGQYAQSMGVSPLFAPIAVEQAMAVQLAAAKGGAFSTNMWGLSGGEHLGQAAANLTIAGAASPLANQMGLAMRLQGLGNVFEKGSDAAAYLTAIQTGQTTFGKGQSVNMNDATFVDMLNKSSNGTLSAPQLWGMMRQNAANSQYFHGSEQAQRSLGGAQGEETLKYLAQRAAEESLTQSGVDPDKRGAIASSVAEALRVARPSQLKDRNKVITDAMIEADPSLANRSPEELKVMAESIWGNMDENSREKFGRSLPDTLAIHGKNQREMTAKEKADNKAEAQVRSLFGGKGTKPWYQRAMEALNETDPDDPQALAKIMAKAMGGVDDSITPERMEGLTNKIKELNDADTKFQQATTDLDVIANTAKGPDAAEKIRAAEEAKSTAEAEYEKIKTEVQDMGKSMGVGEKLEQAGKESMALTGRIEIVEPNGDVRVGSFSGTGEGTSNPVPTTSNIA